MIHYDIYNYIYEIFSNCFKTVFITRITINNYYKYKKDKISNLKVNPLCVDKYDKGQVFDLIDITNNKSDLYEKNIHSRFTCFECQNQIYGEMFMFNDKPFCRNFCRKKSMDKLMK